MCTRFAEAIPLKDIHTSTVAEALVTRNVTVLKRFLSFPELTISRTMYIQEIPSPPPSVY